MLNNEVYKMQIHNGDLKKEGYFYFYRNRSHKQMVTAIDINTTDIYVIAKRALFPKNDVSFALRR